MLPSPANSDGESDRVASQQGLWVQDLACEGDIHAAILQAARVADVMLVAHMGAAVARLAGGTAPVLLPAANGAFLGHLRLLPDRHGRPIPEIEAQTWLHTEDLRDVQREVWEILTAGLSGEEMIRHVAQPLWALSGPRGGDRRRQGAIALVTPGAEPGRDFLMALGRSHPVAVARMRLGLACPDSIAAELKWA